MKITHCSRLRETVFTTLAFVACCSGAFAALPTPDADGNVTITASTQLSAADQETINGWKSLTISFVGTTSAPALWVKGGETVTIPCPVTCTDAAVIGNKSSGEIVFANTFSASGLEIPFSGPVTFGPGSDILDIKNLATGVAQAEDVITLGEVLGKDSGCVKVQLRGHSTLRFAKEDVFGAMIDNGKSPLVVPGRTSNPSGIIDLNGYDQRIAELSFFTNTSKAYCGTLQIKSETAATLTVTKGFVVSTGKISAFNGQLIGGVSFKLAANKDTGTATFSNSFDYVSSTTGALISARGTIKLLPGTRLPNLSAIRKEGKGNFEIGTSDINGGVELYLKGSGKILINADLIVAHARVWNETEAKYEYLDPGTYSATELGAHIDSASTASLQVVNGDPDVKIGTCTWTGPNGGNLSGSGNWDVVPDFVKGTCKLVFPAGIDNVCVDGELNVFGITIAEDADHPTFTFARPSSGASALKVGEDGFAFGRNVVFEADVVSTFSDDAVWALPEGLSLAFNGTLATAGASTIKRLVIDGAGSVALNGDNSALTRPLLLTNVVALTIGHSNALGSAGTSYVNADTLGTVALAKGLNDLNGDFFVQMPFGTPTGTKYAWMTIPSGTGAFRINGRLSARGVNITQSTKYDTWSDYFFIRSGRNLDFVGVVDLLSLRRIQVSMAAGTEVRFLSGITRGYQRANDNSLPIDVRLYADDATATARIFGTIDKAGEIFLGRIRLKTEIDDPFKATTPYLCMMVLSYAPTKADHYPEPGHCEWSIFDLNGHTVKFGYFDPFGDVDAKMELIPESYCEITSETPATLEIIGKGANNCRYPYKFTGAVTVDITSTESRITNDVIKAVSTTGGDLRMASGCFRFSDGAGWVGSTNIVLKGTGRIILAEGAVGFSKGSRKTTVAHLQFPEEGGVLDIASGVTTTVRCCSVGDTFLAPGEYHAGDAVLGDHLIGGGTLTVKYGDADTFGGGMLLFVK